MLHRAIQETGQHERDGHQVSSRVAAYLQAGGVVMADTSGPVPYWGGSFLAWVAIKDGLTPPVAPSDPESWRDWGHPLVEPAAGSIVIMTDGAGRSQLRVGIVARAAAHRVYVVGCHDGVVGTRIYALDQVIEARRPPATQIVSAAQPQSVDVRITVEQQAAQQAPWQSPPGAPTWFDKRRAIEDANVIDHIPAATSPTPDARTIPSDTAQHKSTLPAVFDDLLALRWRAIREIAAHADELKMKWPEQDRMKYVASIAVMSVDAVCAARDRASIDAARMRLIEVLRTS